MKRRALRPGIFFLAAGYIFISVNCQAEALTTPAYSSDNELYRKIASDLSQDILEFDGISASAAARRALADRWNNFLSLGPQAFNPLSIPAQSPASTSHTIISELVDPSPAAATSFFADTPLVNFGGGLFRGLPASKLSAKVADYTNVPFTANAPNAPHTIRDLQGYADARLGPALAKAIREGKVDVDVVGETSERLSAQAKNSGRKLIRIPSLYEKWGIEKFYEITPGLGKPRIVLRVPPNLQIVQHYAEMVSSQGGILHSTSLHRLDRELYRAAFKDSVARLFQSLPEKADYVALGYAKQWAEALNQADSDWKLASSVDTKNFNGLSGKLLKLQSRSRPELTRNILALSEEKTIWGEASSFLVEGVAAQKPKSIFFLGSAGSLSKDLNVYNVSVPSSFLKLSGEEKIKNQVYELLHQPGNYFWNSGAPFRTATLGSTSGSDIFPESTREFLSGFRETYFPKWNENGIFIRFGAKHGNTSSPVEETQAFLRMEQGQQVDTIDVEQSLVAKAIADYNKRTGSKIGFGAVNVITDKPALSPAETMAADLTTVDATKKAAARVAAVDTILDTITRDTLGSESLPANTGHAPPPLNTLPSKPCSLLFGGLPVSVANP